MQKWIKCCTRKEHFRKCLINHSFKRLGTIIKINKMHSTHNPATISENQSFIYEHTKSWTNGFGLNFDIK